MVLGELGQAGIGLAAVIGALNAWRNIRKTRIEVGVVHKLVNDHADKQDTRISELTNELSDKKVRDAGDLPSA